ncbi:hypothetical protein GGF42_003569 [Coemansia sp. RSA 2424]|nr:hypothetical protein GGF42_003569 [Coemansia sp. RSA 2424]
MTAAVSLPTDMLTCYVVRHGERIDHIDDTWALTSSTPYDPPLTADGWIQAQRAGTMIHDLEAQHIDDNLSTEYIMLVSPFLRCAQTGEGICTGFHHAQTTNRQKWRVMVEPGLSEVINESYFGCAENVPTGIITERQSELHTGAVCGNMEYDAGYRAVCEELPKFPEDFQMMMARFVAVLDRIALRFIGGSKRVVVVLVTHGAGVAALRWATTRKLVPANDVPYCALFRATAISRTLAIPAFGSTRVPAFTWTVNEANL